MNVARKLEILKTLAGKGLGFPADQVYLDDKTLLATNGWQVLAFQLSDEDMWALELSAFSTLDKGAEEYQKRQKAKANSEKPKAPDSIRKWLSLAAATQVVDFTRLRDFLHADEYLRCPHCSGSGQRPIEEVDLIEFEDPFDKLRVAVFDGARMQVRLLLGVLSYLPAGETVQLSTWVESGHIRSGKAEGPILRIIGDGWTLIQMSVTEVEGFEVQVFPLEPKQVTA